mgnify:CR=1 FL=1
MTVTTFSTLPNRQHLLALGAGVAALHLVLLVSSGSNIWRLQPESQKLGPLQTRVLSTEMAQPKLDSAVPAPPVARPVLRAPAREAMPHSQQSQDAGMQAVASAALPAPPEDPAVLPTRIAPPKDITEPVPPSSTSPVPPIVNPSEPAIKQASPNASALVAKVGNFPDNTQINYKLTGQERGLNYHASGSLKWQAKAGTALPKAYEAELRVKAFLVGSRVWRSVGQLSENGLSPARYSDSWRGERAAHFEADTQKISFSGNLPSAPLLPGAQDQVSLFKGRKNADYTKLDTVNFKLQGGPFSALYIDLVKYPDFIFSNEAFELYDFNLEENTQINDRQVLVLAFKQKEGIESPLYYGKLYIDAKSLAVVSATFALNVENKVKAGLMFTRKKPAGLDIYPTEVRYQINYRQQKDKWIYAYSRADLTFKLNWAKRIFNTVYTTSIEMAVTDWKKQEKNENTNTQKLSSNVIMSDKVKSLGDPDFWGKYNIIEPEKSIEAAIRKIQRKALSEGGVE